MMKNRTMVCAGTATMLQAVGQVILTSVGIAQYFCVVDFLQGLPMLLYIKILYFHNPGPCGARINIGEVIEELPNAASVLLTRESVPVFRTFVINCIALGLGVIWFIVSVVMMTGGSKNEHTKPTRWPWIIVTVMICALDVVATVTYANDSFHTRTFADIMDFVGGVASGVGNRELDTALASWIMVMLYSRFAVLFLLNLMLVVLVVLDTKQLRKTEDAIIQVEAPTCMGQETQTNEDSSIRDTEETSIPSEEPPRIPRPGLSQSFRKMKTFLFKMATPAQRRSSVPDSAESTMKRLPPAQTADDKKRTVNFPENLLSLPQRLENMIAEQQRRLDRAVIDTAGRSPPRVSQSLPQLSDPERPDTEAPQDPLRGRRGTAAELQGQLPWAYIPASAHRMRDQLPPDEDLPPVPLPDYTAIPSGRKASVHRAASSLSSLTRKRGYMATQSTLPPLTQLDVLY